MQENTDQNNFENGHFLRSGDSTENGSDTELDLPIDEKAAVIGLVSHFCWYPFVSCLFIDQKILEYYRILG